MAAGGRSIISRMADIHGCVRYPEPAEHQLDFTSAEWSWPFETAENSSFLKFPPALVDFFFAHSNAKAKQGARHGRNLRWRNIARGARGVVWLYQSNQIDQRASDPAALKPRPPRHPTVELLHYVITGDTDRAMFPLPAKFSWNGPGRASSGTATTCLVGQTEKYELERAKRRGLFLTDERPVKTVNSYALLRVRSSSPGWTNDDGRGNKLIST